MRLCGEDLLDAAELEFLERKYDSVTMESIAIRAGMGRSSTYHFFPNKDAILAAVQERFYEPMRGLMTQAHADVNPVDGLKKFIRSYFEYWSKHPRELELHLLLRSRIVGNHAVWPLSNAFVAEMIIWYDGLLRRAVRLGLLEKHKTLDRATVLFCAVEGALQHVTTSKLLSVKKAAARIERELLEEGMRDEG